jgi:ferredoxin
MTAMKLIADPERCVTAGLCVLTAPAVFTQDDDRGTVVLLMEEVMPEHEEAVRKAVFLCPSGAISLHEDGEPTAEGAL